MKLFDVLSLNSKVGTFQNNAFNLKAIKKN